MRTVDKEHKPQKHIAKSCELSEVSENITIAERLAKVREVLMNYNEDCHDDNAKSVDSLVTGGWDNWGNWDNWANWNNWGNWDNWGNY